MGQGGPSATVQTPPNHVHQKPPSSGLQVPAAVGQTGQVSLNSQGATAPPNSIYDVSVNYTGGYVNPLNLDYSAGVATVTVSPRGNSAARSQTSISSSR
jgi:hypothetical protein